MQSLHCREITREAAASYENAQQFADNTRHVHNCTVVHTNHGDQRIIRCQSNQNLNVT